MITSKREMFTRMFHIEGYSTARLTQVCAWLIALMVVCTLVCSVEHQVWHALTSAACVS